MFQKLKTWIRKFWNPNLLTLGDSFEVDQTTKNELGRGAYGIVFRGINIHTREDVAVKKVTRNSMTQTYITRELTFMTRCKHGNIIKLLWSEEDEYSRYFVMEYCPFGNLNNFMRDREISHGLCLSFMLNLGEAVLYLHKLNISHRDIKPLNVLVWENAGGLYLKLADFGLARYFPVSSTGFDATRDTGTFSWIIS